MKSKSLRTIQNKARIENGENARLKACDKDTKSRKSAKGYLLTRGNWNKVSDQH